ncbi:hypothetical protein VNO77_04255 [Canavalia gladiata]|uniref:Uncharacterized protein n=1 Tax=Canavalia gladiata TaxID=3824 RepID=A0AAN9N1C6_CANGL
MQPSYDHAGNFEADKAGISYHVKDHMRPVFGLLEAPGINEINEESSMHVDTLRMQHEEWAMRRSAQSYRAIAMLWAQVGYQADWAARIIVNLAAVLIGPWQLLNLGPCRFNVHGSQANYKSGCLESSRPKPS